MNLILDMARGIAALSVFLFHVRDLLEPSMPMLARVARFGSLGVALFFVISGYVITASAESALKKGEPAGAFLKRRFLRIFPPFWLSILVVLALPYVLAGISAFKGGAFEAPHPRYAELSGLEWVQLVSLVKIFQAVGDDLQGQFNQVNSVYWTLAIEFQFYLCVFAALCLRRHFHPILAVVTAASLLLLAWPLPINGGLFIHLWPLFAVGIGLFYLLRRDISPAAVFGGARLVVGTLLAVSLGSVLMLAEQGTLTRLLEGVFPSVGMGFAVVCAFILWLATAFAPELEAGLKHGPLPIRVGIKGAVFLGTISYSVYLLHAVLISLPGMFVRQLVPASSFLTPLLTIGATLVLCAVFYRVAEKPFMSKRLRAINKAALEGDEAPAAERY
jgi:peptidoglycan/LPS O-acetylase OafA/YrhL